MRDSMTHRGPDYAGEWYSPDLRVGLAHRRLAIIDLSPRGRQPMCDKSGKLVIVFNGEIYNFLDLRNRLASIGHSFRSRSDTEVILKAYRAWGTDCLMELDGMFAFCIYDHDQRLLFLARDRAGEKPLYYRHYHGQFCFSSELKALMTDPGTQRIINLEALNQYLAYGYIMAPMSILQGIEKLPPGHAMVYDTDHGTLRSWKYWDLPDPVADTHVSIEELSSEFKSLLIESVRRQLVADVPVGILLSGGCDSSLVTAIASEVSSQPVKTFTVTFPGHPKYDEGPFARIIASHFGTDHMEIEADESVWELMEKLATQFDEPFADHAMIPTYLVARAIRPYVTVALSGDGGDELFGGYPHYASLLKMARLRSFVPSPLRSLLAWYASRFISTGTRFRNHLIGFRSHFDTSVAHVNMFFDQHSRGRLLGPEFIGAIDLGRPERLRASHCLTAHSPLRQAMQADFKTTLPDDYLVKLDRASMLASLEIRAPFLNYRLIEFAYRSVPDRYKVADGKSRILERHTAQRLLPPSLSLDRKQGFSMPVNTWFNDTWGQFMKSILIDPRQTFFEEKFVLKLFSNPRGIKSNANRLFALTIFELWCRFYDVSI